MDLLAEVKVEDDALRCEWSKLFDRWLIANKTKAAVRAVEAIVFLMLGNRNSRQRTLAKGAVSLRLLTMIL
jgi:hypothetical protein